jgi:hypothetical protein
MASAGADARRRAASEPGIGRGEVNEPHRRSSSGRGVRVTVANQAMWQSPHEIPATSFEGHELRAVARFDSPRRAGLRGGVRGSGDPRAVQRYGVDRSGEILESKRGWPRCLREVAWAR